MKELSPEQKEKIDFLLLKLEKMGRRPGPGLIWLWDLGEDSRIYWASLRHDLDYALRAAGMNDAETSQVADERFFKQIGKNPQDEFDNIENLLFVGFVELHGAFNWPTPATDDVARKEALEESITLLRILRIAGEM